MRKPKKVSESRLHSRPFLEINSQYDVESLKGTEREEFSYEMTKRYMTDQFKAVRKNSHRFGEGVEFTQRQLAQIAGVHETWVSKFEGGRITNPQLRTLTNLAYSLGCCLEVRLVPYSYYLALNSRTPPGQHPNPKIPSLEEEVSQRKKLTGEGGGQG